MLQAVEEMEMEMAVREQAAGGIGIAPVTGFYHRGFSRALRLFFLPKRANPAPLDTPGVSGQCCAGSGVRG
jgi:hypothetical protein